MKYFPSVPTTLILVAIAIAVIFGANRKSVDAPWSQFEEVGQSEHEIAVQQQAPDSAKKDPVFFGYSWLLLIGLLVVGLVIRQRGLNKLPKSAKPTPFWMRWGRTGLDIQYRPYRKDER